MGILNRKEEKAEAKEAVRRTRMREMVDKIFENTKEERDDMARYLQMFEGKWWKKEKLSDFDSEVAMNYIFSTVQTVAPLLTDNRPQWSVRARKVYLQKASEAWRLSTEYLWDKLELDSKLYMATLNSRIRKIGIWEILYDPDAETGGELSVNVVSPPTFFIAPGFTDVWETPMCGTRERVPISLIRERFPEKGKEVKPDEKDEAQGNTEMEEFEWHTKFATLYRVWFKSDDMEDYYIGADGKEVDKDDDGAEKQRRKKYPYGKMFTFTKSVTLAEDRYDYFHGKPPWVVLYAYPIPDNFFGQGDPEQLEHLNKAFNEALQLMVRWMEDYSDPPWLVDTNSGLNKEMVKQALLEGSAILDVDMRASPTPLTKATVQPPNAVLPQLLGALSKLIEEMSSVTEIAKGMTTKTERQSATEISTQLESSYTRVRQAVRNQEQFLKRALHLILELQQQYYDTPRDFNYKTPDLSGSRTWAKISNQPEVLQNYIWPNAGKPQPEIEQARQNMGDTELEEDKQAEQDYATFKEYIKELGPEDPVYCAFDIEIQTNSTLPMDRQSLANLFIRLLEMAAGNPVTGLPMWQATLDNLRVPRHKEIYEKMEENFQKQAQSKAGPMPVPGGM